VARKGQGHADDVPLHAEEELNPFRESVEDDRLVSVEPDAILDVVVRQNSGQL